MLSVLEEIEMKEKIDKIVKVIIFLLILLICLESIANVTKRKYAYQKTADFFNQKENFDVLFFGSSHVLNSIYPMELWNDYGIVSYNMARESSTLAISYYNLLLACQETKPKMIVVDTYRILGNYKIYAPNYTNSMHKTFDSYPLSYTKYLAIKDLCGEEKLLDHIMEFLFNFSIYHARWNELREEDFKNINEYEKGAESKIGVVSPNKMNEFNLVDAYEGEETTNVKYLRKIIEYCQVNNIEVLVTYNPYPAPDEDIAASKYVKIICDEYDVDYINFLGIDVVDYDTDCYDKSSHLNVSGARKVTNYLGKYIMENYDIQDQRKNKNYDFWQEDYNEYIDLKISNLSDSESRLVRYLMLLYGEKDIRYEIKIASKKKIIEGSTFQRLLGNLGNNYQIDDIAFESHKDKTVKITTYDNRNGCEITTVWF